MSDPSTSGMVTCPRCGTQLSVLQRFCSQCGSAVPAARVGAVPPPVPPRWKPAAVPPPMPQVHPSPPMMAPPPPPLGRSHWPTLALVSGLTLPGAGQAYNGKVFRAFLIALIAAALAAWAMSSGQPKPLPLALAGGWQVLMAGLAWMAARGIVGRGGRFAKGGLPWVFLQLWLVANLVVAVLVGLTISGVLE